MLAIKAYASGSTGNCYTLTNGQATIMLDCGLPFREIQRLTGYKLPDAVLVTHEHKDHSKAVKDFIKRGVDIYMTPGTAEAIGICSNALEAEGLGITWQHRIFIMQDGELLGLSRDGIISASVFATQHDAKEPCGFLVDDGEDRVLYATDTYYLRYKFPGLTKIMVEANHSYDIIRENVADGVLDKRLAERLTKSHFSIENVLDFLKANDLSRVKEIWLIHLSKGNADPALFKKMVMEATGKMVYVAGERGILSTNKTCSFM